MKFINLILLGGCLTFASVAKADDAYKVTVTRKDHNVYKFNSGNVRGIILTKYCYEYAISEEAILKYEKYSYDNKLIFISDGTVCDVDKVYAD